MRDRTVADQHSIVAALFVFAVIIGYVILGLIDTRHSQGTHSVGKRVMRGVGRIALATTLGVPCGWCFY